MGIGGGQFIQEWYAVAPNPFTADIISVKSTQSGEVWYGVIAFAVSGANTASPFDVNPSLPKVQANIACPGNDPCNTGVSTNGADFVFQLGGDTGYSIQTAGPGFTLIQSGRSGQDAYAQYDVTSGPLSSVTLAFGTSQGNDFGMITDALQPAQSTTSSSSTSSTTTSTSSSTSSSTTTTSTTPPSLDGSAKNGCGYATSCSVSLTTTHSSDVVVVGCDCWPSAGSFSVRDGLGLTFQARTGQVSIGGGQFIQEWYAVAPSVLSNDAVSVTSTVSGEVWYGVVAFAVSGANTASPFDPNVSLPKAQANINCLNNYPCNTGVSTNGPDLVFQFGGDTGYDKQTAGSGFTLIQAGTSGQDAYAQYEITSNPLSSATLSFGTSQGSDFGAITDAIQSGASSLDPTVASITPNPASVGDGSMITFTATITDTDSVPTTPTGVVAWNDGGAGGGFGSSSSCTLSTLSASSSTCSITYTASSTPGSVTVTGSYKGDANHAVSSGTSSLTVGSSSAGGDWPTFTLDNQNSRYQANSTVTSSNIANLAPQWSIVTPYSVTSTPVVLNGNVYFDDWGGDVYSANLVTGQINWQVNLGHAISSTPALANGMVYVGMGPANTTEVFALSQADGHIVWQTTLKTNMDAIWASPTIFNGLLYIGVGSSGDESNASWIGQLFALNANTGAVAWTFNAAIGSAGGDGIWGSVVVDPSLNSIFFGTGNPYGGGSGPSILYGYSIVSLDATTGNLNWATPVYTSTSAGGDLDFGSTPNLFSVSIGSTTYKAIGLGNKNGIYYVLDRTNGALLTSTTVDSAGEGEGIRGVGGFFYLSSNNPEIFVPSAYSKAGILAAITPSNGNVQWSFPTPGSLIGSVAVIPGAVLFGDTNGNMYALSTTGQQLLAQSLPSGIYGGITVAEGHVLVPTAYGKTTGVYAFAPSTTSIKLDGSGNCSSGLSPKCTITLVTSTPNDLIYVQESSQSGHTTAPPTDTAGLVYTLRAGESSANRYTSVWVAQQSGSGPDTITCNGDNGGARIGCIAFAISGINLSSPFDNNPSVPCAATSTSNSPSCTLSTNHASVIILGFVTYGCNGAIPTPDSGFAIIQSFTGSCNADSAVEYRIVSTPQTNLSVGFALNVSTEWDLIGEALVGLA